jgi:hypothetical protein
MGCFRKRGQGAARADQDVGGDDRRPAGVGDDADPVAFRDRLGGEGGGGLDQVALVAEGEDPRLFEDEIRGDVFLGQPAGVGGGRLGAFPGAAGLHRQDRLLGRDRGCRPHEVGRVPEAFDIGHDDPRAVIVPQIAHDFGDGDIDGIPVGGIDAGADTRLGEGLVNDLGDPAAQGDDGDESRLRFREGEVAVGADRGVAVDDSLAVRS